MKIRKILAFAVCLFIAQSEFATANITELDFRVNQQTGALQNISFKNDNRDMNWLLSTDGSQYKWVDESHGWGLGEMTLIMSGTAVRKRWLKPESVISNHNKTISTYNTGEIELVISRQLRRNTLIEEIVFRNKSNQPVSLKDIAINTPFNDNYPDSETCHRARANAHIWIGNHNAYINAMHMSGKAPHLGLVLTKGSIVNYEIRERSAEKGSSNFRGVVLLNPEDILLEPGKSYSLEWQLFSHTGWDDFFEKLVCLGSVAGRSNQYVFETGDTARIEFQYNSTLKNPLVDVNGKALKFITKGKKIVVEYPVTSSGELIFRLNYNQGKSTFVQCLAVSTIKELIEKRVNFILEKQQYFNPDDSRNGAYMVYDNELNKIFFNNTGHKRSDSDEGRERLGMGILLALQYQVTKEAKIRESLQKYAKFVRTLQRDDYTTFSSADHQSRNRPYNYPWVARFYFEMFKVTGDTEYLTHGYKTMKMFFRRFGHNFYAIDLPVMGYSLLRNNGFTEEAESLLSDFIKTADTYYANGWLYPKSEVNYEQTIVAPGVIVQLQLYQITNDEKYLRGAKEQLPMLESFAGLQPSYSLNEIAIRHWDGYWFGKDRLWGDVFPHYWSVLNAHAYSLYAECTGDSSYQLRAENILRNNLCQFFEDGKASCAFIYPGKIDGEKAHMFDSFANDQDWALVFYLGIMGNMFSHK